MQVPPDRIAAAAPVAGIRDIKGCSFTRPVPVIAFHGTADPFVGYTAGSVRPLQAPDPRWLGQDTRGTWAPLAGLSKGPTIPKITADWAKRNGCGTKPVERR